MISILISISIVGTIAFGLAIALALLWHNRRYPIIKDERDGTELAKVTMTFPPAYWGK